MNHLFQSTVLSVCLGLLTLAFRRNRASVRFWLWFAASVKFLAPFSLLVSLGSVVPAPRPAVPVAVVQLVEPFVVAPAAVAIAPRQIDWLPIVWACGFAVVTGARFRGWLRVRAALRASAPSDIPSVRISAGLLEPGVVGWWRPTLLVPAGIFERLTPPQLQAVLAHEFCHVRRRDNLLAAIHMLVEAIFWFHPLVWWIGARLVEERERACDEEVVRSGSAPDDYADAILNICKLYVESPLPCVAGVTGADLKKRIEAILAGRMAFRVSGPKKVALALVAGAAVAIPLLFGMQTPAVRPKFEVASIKLCEPGDMGGRSGKQQSAEPSPVQLDVNCQTVANLIVRAYGSPLSGGPSWINSERYRIDAKASSPESRDTMNGPMMQTLLEDRFHLKVRRENKDEPVYVMTAPKGAAKLKPAAEGSCETDRAKAIAARQAGQPSPVMCGIFFARKKELPGIVTVNTRGMTLAAFAKSLSDLMDRPVVDRTGTAGTFDLYAEFLPDESTLGLLGRELFAAPEGIAPEPSPTLIAALQEQLGLKLERAIAPREYLVVDHVERPSEN